MKKAPAAAKKAAAPGGVKKADPARPSAAGPARGPGSSAPEPRGLPWWGWLLIAVAVLMGIWLVLTVWTGSRVQAQVAKALEEMRERPVLASLAVKREAFKRGFFSSDLVVSVGPAEPEEDDVPVRFISRIHHGPVVTGDGAPRFLMLHGVTRLDWKALGPKAADAVESAFGGAEPLELRSSLAYGGGTRHEWRLEPGRLEEEEIRLFFEGGRGDLETAQRPARAKGVLEIGRLEWQIRNKGEPFHLSLEPSRAEIDFAEGQVLKAEGGIGALRLETVPGDAGPVQVEIDEARLEARFQRVAPDIALLVGRGEVDVPRVRIRQREAALALDQMRLGTETRVEDGRVASFVRYEVDHLEWKQAGGGAGGAATEPLQGAASLEAGMRGFDAANLAAMRKSYREFRALRGRRERGITGEGEESPGEEEQERLREALHGMLELVEPGTEIYLDTDLGGGAVRVSFQAGLGGDKSLKDLATIRELVQAVTGGLTIFLRHGVLPEEQVTERLGPQIEMGLVKRTAEGLSFEGGLENGQLLLGGQPTPILQFLGPLLDQPIPWEEILKTLEKAGRSAGSR